MIPHEKVIRACGKRCRLGEISELPIGDPQSRPGDLLPHLGQQRRHQPGVIGLPIGMRGHRHH
jgi:hypothetical protein